MTGVTVSSLEYNVFCIPQKQIFPVLWIPSTALKDAYHHTIHAYTAGVAVAQRKKLILRMRVGRLLTAAVVHIWFHLLLVERSKQCVNASTTISQIAYVIG